MSLPKTRCHTRGRQNGSALILTMVLLAFLVLLLVSLASIARVETTIGSNLEAQAQARQHALVALDLALGQLQLHTGPDQRATSIAGGFDAAAGGRQMTGVWDGDAANPMPLAWLFSGSDAADPPGEWVFELNDAHAELVGSNTAGNDPAAQVVVPKQPVRAGVVPGQAGTVVVGHHAWWIGDQGVKASVAVPDRTAEIDYTPYASGELRRRIRQQIALGARAESFEPANPQNAAIAAQAIAFNQIAFFEDDASRRIGGEPLRENFHAWSVGNRAVLANARQGGLRQDLSLTPDLLGPAFAAWADYRSYMEDPQTPAFPEPLPEYGADPVRRRYRISPREPAGHAGVAPVLTYFYLLLSVRKQNANAPYTVSLRWAAALWNPYTSALVPEDLRLEISGLPDSIAFVNAATDVTDTTISLRNTHGDPLRVTLPWTDDPQRPEQHSWLPGRVYNWVHLQGSPLVPGGNNAGRFNSRDLGAAAGGLIASIPGSSLVNGSTPLALRLAHPTVLTVRLVRARDNAVLATYRSPTYEAVPTTTPRPASNQTSQLGFLFRMAESFDTIATPEVWLTTPGRDPRSEFFPADGVVAVPNGPNPAVYENFITISAPDRFFDRDITRGLSYNEDVPLFELPRAPLLSVGQLQHLHVPGARPFAIGNSWGAGVMVNGIGGNALFDRFHFSGLAEGVEPDLAGRQRLPNPLLELLPANAAGRVLTVAEVRNAAGGHSARHLLQAGAFNLNSIDRTAWLATLRGVRFPGTAPFVYLEAATGSGTAGDGSLAQAQAGAAHFLRFPQSAQEVFRADDAYAQSLTSATGSGPIINTPLFRRGIRILDAEQVTALADAVVTRIRRKHAASGPFRSLEEFLGPSPLFDGQSLLEQAIDEAAINADIAEFSSQWLTQADIMNALAPTLFSRSDTFLIRVYGEAVNPATQATTGRAWAEAVAQRFPDYLDSSQPAETALGDLNSTNARFGRRFHIVSFRWLNSRDL